MGQTADSPSRDPQRDRDRHAGPRVPRQKLLIRCCEGLLFQKGKGGGKRQEGGDLSINGTFWLVKSRVGEVLLIFNWRSALKCTRKTSDAISKL